MLDPNSDLMKAMVEARQEQLRRLGKRPIAGQDAGAVRKAAGMCLIRLGEWVGGIREQPARADVSGKLAVP